MMRAYVINNCQNKNLITQINSRNIKVVPD